MQPHLVNELYQNHVVLNFDQIKEPGRIFKKPMHIIAKCLSMRHIILRGQRVPTVEHAVCIYIYIIYLYIYLFIGLSGSMV